MRVVSLFSGGGGLDLGFIKAGFNIVYAADINPNAVAAYRANIGDHIVRADLSSVDPASLPPCDVVIGGPPCQSFSLAGRRDASDNRGQLVWNYIDIVCALRPKAFLLENVTGLLSAKDANGDKVLPQLTAAFANLGYSVVFSVLNAADFGVPQRRHRLILVGLRGTAAYMFPTSPLTSPVSVSDAISDLLPTSPSDALTPYSSPPKSVYQELMRVNCKGVTEHALPQMSELDRYIISYVKPGGNYRDIPSDVPSKRIRDMQRTGGRTTYYGRLLPNEPAYTINTYFNRPNSGCNIHYGENRLITPREALRLQSFPDLYKIDSTSKAGRQLIIGNAVPPLLGFALAESLKEQI